MLPACLLAITLYVFPCRLLQALTFPYLHTLLEWAGLPKPHIFPKDGSTHEVSGLSKTRITEKLSSSPGIISGTSIHSGFMLVLYFTGALLHSSLLSLAISGNQDSKMARLPRW